MPYEHIQLIRDGHVATLKLNRPESRNAMSIAMGDEVARAVEEIRADADIRVLVVTGEGRAFSGGGDLGMLAADAGIGEPHAGMGGPPREFYNRYLSVATLPIPTLAAINGHAIGAGFCFALACDLRIASSNAKLGMTFTKLGIHPGMGATYFLPRLVGTTRACDLLFTGRIIDAEEALAIGLVSALIVPDDLLPAAHSLADRIVANDPRATQLTKVALAAPQDKHPAVELEAQAELFDSPEKHRRMTEFLERPRSKRRTT